MEHQDFNTIVFTKKTNSEQSKKGPQGPTGPQGPSKNDSLIKYEENKKLGSILASSRVTKGYKSQNDFVKNLSKVRLNISVQIYGRWEANKEVPTNEQIAKMEKLLGVKLPRNKKIVRDDLTNNL